MTLPEPVIQAAGIQEGDRFFVEVVPESPGSLRLHRIRPSYAGALQDVYDDPTAYLDAERGGWEQAIDAQELEAAIAPGASLLLDTSVALAYLTGSESTSDLATQVVDSYVATGRNPAVVSMVTVEEILVRTFRAGPAAVATAEGFLNFFAEMTLIDVTYDIAREAARIRAKGGLRTPDALIIASAIVTGTDVLVTSDRSWWAALELLAADVGLVVLAT